MKDGVNSSERIESQPKAKVNSFIADIYEESPPPKIVDELEDYLSSGVEEIHTCVLSYWRQKVYTWPRLSAMARDYLAITATSASSERSLSSGRHLLGLYRRSMLPKTMQACMCLRSWARCGISEQIEQQLVLPIPTLVPQTALSTHENISDVLEIH